MIISALAPALDSRTATVAEDDEGIVVQAGGATFVFRCFLNADASFDGETFECLPVRAEAIAPLKISKLRVEGTDTQTIGYLFPVSFLDGERALESDEKWIRVYARAASLRIIKQGALNAAALPITKIDIHNDLTISSCFRADQCVAVFGRAKLDSLSYSIADASLMLQEHGFRPVRLDAGTRAFRGHSAAISLGRPSPYLAAEAQQYSVMLEIASNISHPPSRLLCVYQIVEALIQKLFVASITEIVNGSALNPDPWKMKESLQKATNEKDRIAQILNKCSGISDVSAKSEICRLACVSFLSKIDPSLDTSKGTWSDLMYQSRNYVVHRQHQILSDYDSEIDEVANSLEEILYAILRKFTL